MNRDRASSEGPAPRGSSKTSNENSGLIDLRALMAAAKSTAPAEPRDAGDLGPLAVYPLGAPPSQRPPSPSAPALVLDPPVLAQPAPAPAGRGQKIFAAAAVLVLVGVAVGATALLAGRGSNKAAPGAPVDGNATSTLQAPAENVKNVAPAGEPGKDPGAVPGEKAPADTAAPPPAGSPDTRARTAAPGPLPKSAKGPVPAKTTPGPKTPPVTPPKADPCKGDLLCAMKRSTEKH